MTYSDSIFNKGQIWAGRRGLDSRKRYIFSSPPRSYWLWIPPKSRPSDIRACLSVGAKRTQPMYKLCPVLPPRPLYTFHVDVGYRRHFYFRVTILIDEPEVTLQELFAIHHLLNPSQADVFYHFVFKYKTAQNNGKNNFHIGWELFSSQPCADQLWGPPNLLC